MLNDQDIQDVQLMAQEEYGIELTNQEALDLGERLLAMWRAIYKPIASEK